MIRRIKSHWPDVPVVLGGIYATLCNKHAQKLSRADSIVSGPGELEAVRILERLTGKEISGVPDVNDLDSLPYPEYELLTSKNALPIITSRGCPFRCTYCASSFLVPRYYQRNHLKVADELEFFVNKHGTTDYIFYDDALLFNTASHAVPLFNEILRRKLPVRLHSPNGLHLKYITHQVADLMLEAGFKTIRLGLETADLDMQQTTGGKVSTDEFISAAGALKKAGFSDKEMGVYILAGLPRQQAKAVYNTIQLVKDQEIKPMIAEYSPIPHTALWDEAISSSPFPIASEPLFHNNTLLPCQWEKFTLENLQKLKIDSRKI